MDNEVAVALVALVIAILALLVTTTQALAQIFSTAEGHVIAGVDAQGRMLTMLQISPLSRIRHWTLGQADQTQMAMVAVPFRGPVHDSRYNFGTAVWHSPKPQTIRTNPDWEQILGARCARICTRGRRDLGIGPHA